MEIKTTLKQEIIKLVRLSATKIVRDTDFDFLWIRIKTGDLISYKYVYNVTEYEWVEELGLLVVRLVAGASF